MNYGTRIIGTGSAFPEQLVTNDDLVQKLAAQNVETSDQWIRERTGIHQRHYAKPDTPEEYNSAFGERAARQALEMAGKRPEDIDQIVFATCSAETQLPATACWMQEKLGARNAWAMDINAACSGFIYGLAIVDQFIQSGHTKTALVVGGEVLTPYLDWEDRSSCILFGDGAGAAVVEQVSGDYPNRILSSHLGSNGKHGELLHVPASGSRMELTPERYAQKLNKIQMNGKEIFKVAVRTLVDYAHQALKANQMELDDIQWFAPHQANRRILDAVIKRLGVPSEKVLINVDRYGNTSAATIPTLLDGAVREGKIKAGDTVLLDAFGAGLTFASMMLRW
jgi:3-oxoacyl-[acyl-carrier-protein] synthase-3